MAFQGGAELCVPGGKAESGNMFAADAGEGLQKQLGEIAEGHGVFATDASLSKEEKDASERGIDVGGGGEIGAEGFEFGQMGEIGGIRIVSGGAAGAAFGGMIGAEMRGLIAALAAVGEGEGAAVRRSSRRRFS